VLGTGINVNLEADHLPAGNASSLLVELGRTVDRAELLVTLLDLLERRYDAWVERARAG
jgi:BirA family biotin operon repressor/biotin-[acetyl-CoA-carboxylase] ligase